MERKDFLKKGLVSGALLGVSALASASGSADNSKQQDGKEQLAKVQIPKAILKKL